MMLRQYDIEVYEAKTGKEGLGYIKKTGFDLLMFAYELQDMDGLQFYQKCTLKRSLHPQISLLVTSSAQEKTLQDATDAGVTACFSKLDLDNLDRFVANLIKPLAQRFKCHALIVEDSMTATMLYEAALRKLGFTYDCYQDAESAIVSIKNQNYDLIITDFKLKGVGDGFAVIRAVRNLPEPQSRTPILAISSFNSAARRVQLLLNGANDFISKASSLEEFEIRLYNLVSNHHLVKKLELQYKTMQEMATHDPLTKLYNRHYLEIAVDSVFSEANAKSEQLSLLVLDIDFFKKINDGYGHKVGDQVLEEIAKFLRKFFADYPLVFRIGGEEFVVLLPKLSEAEAYLKAAQLCKKLELANLLGLNVTVSIGVAAYALNDDYDKLFHRADLALNKAKQNGRNCALAASVVC